MINNKPASTNKRCKCKKYIVLQDFWLEHIKLKKGQVITEPVSQRWIALRLIAPFCPNVDIGRQEAQRVAADTHTDKPLETQIEVDESEVFVNSRNSSEEAQEQSTQAKKKRGRRKKSDTVIVELPEKSEIELQKMIETEVDAL